MLDFTLRLQRQHEGDISPDHRAERGQVFTPPGIARFMAGLFSTIPDEFHLLDPGAGVGVLTAAFCERVCKLRSPRRIVAHLFENDCAVIPLLKGNMDHCRDALADAGHTLEVVIHEEDFVVSASQEINGRDLFSAKPLQAEFDGVVMNPPYFKLRKDSLHAKLMSKIVHGQPNIYAFFMALGARLLKPGGEMVAITPRSFCNGLYFREFRHWLFRRVSLDHIHIFESRRDAFKGASVLQESIVTKSHRLGTASARITITTSLGGDLDGDLNRADYPVEEVIDNSVGDNVIRIPENREDRAILELVESFPLRFSDVGLRISTGPVVSFRATEFLLDDIKGQCAVPLLLPHNVKAFQVSWPVAKCGKPVAIRSCDRSAKILVPTRNLVLLKRFTSKEERRRLTAGCLLKEQYCFPLIGLENHLNYVCHADRELSEEETFGIAAIFNSSLYDRYFRILSGNTQVNATEIRSLNFPDMKTLGAIGKKVQRGIEDSEAIVLSELGVGAAMERSLAES